MLSSKYINGVVCVPFALSRSSGSSAVPTTCSLPPRSVLEPMFTASDTVEDWEHTLQQWAEREITFEGTLLKKALPRFERIMITVALKHTQGHRQSAAKLLGWGRNTLARKIKELAIELPP